MLNSRRLSHLSSSHVTTFGALTWKPFGSEDPPVVCSSADSLLAVW